MTRPNVDNAGHRAVAEPNTVLLGLVGSTVHGVTVDSADDRDEMGICIEPPEYVAGLRRFEQWVYRTQPEGARSGPGDIDRTVYSLRKWCRLALAGNPTVMLLPARARGAVRDCRYGFDTKYAGHVLRLGYQGI